MFSAKNFNRVTVVLVILLLSSVIMSTITDVRADFHIQLEFERLLSDVDEFNDLHASFLLENDQTEEIPVELKYESGSEALVSAFENLYNADSYYYEANGFLTVTLDVIVAKLEVLFSYEMKSALFPNGDKYQEVIAYSDVLGGQIGAFATYYSEELGKVYQSYTEVVPTINYEKVPIYNSNWNEFTLEEFVEEYGSETGIFIYDVNKRTATKEHYFKPITYSGTNQIKEYHVEHSLNATLATSNYMSFLKPSLEVVSPGFLKTISFTKVSTQAVIRNDGYLKTARFDEEYDFTAYIKDYNVVATAPCNAELTFYFLFYNQEISIETPQINKYDQDLAALNQQ